MPFLSLAKTLGNAFDSGLNATVVTYEASSESLICELEQAISNGAPVQLRFSNGSSLKANSQWQRAADHKGSHLTAFRTPISQFIEQSHPGVKLRGSARVPIRLWVNLENGTGTVTSDLSPEGLRIQSDLRQQVGTTTSLYLDLPDQDGPLSVRARVVWSTRAEAGLQFQNLAAADEIRLLRCLGQATTQRASNFLPDHFQTAPPYRYTLDQTSNSSVLHLSVTNWDFVFQLNRAEVRGQHRGAFGRCEVLQSSPELLALKQKLKISLEQERQLLHLRLFDNEDSLVLEVVAQEVSFQRRPRSQSVHLSSPSQEVGRTPLG